MGSILGNIRGAFGEHSGNIRGEYSGEHSGNIRGTFGEHSGNIRWVMNLIKNPYSFLVFPTHFFVHDLSLNDKGIRIYLSFKNKIKERQM